MANHLTPEEIAKEFAIDRQVRSSGSASRSHVPIYHGKIDKTLFDAVRHEAEEPIALSA